MTCASSRRGSFCLLTSLAIAAGATAQPPAAPNPGAPTLAQPFPMGVQRGTALELNLTGANLHEPTGVLASFPAKITIPTENNNGQDPAKLLVKLDVPKDAPLGWHTLRLATTHGISNLRLFCIDELPQLLEANENHTRASAQSVPAPCVVCGRVDPEQTDYFKFKVEAGQRLSFELLGRRLGSGLDPILHLVNPSSGRPLAMSDDSPGQSKDPRLTCTFKEAGEYVLEVRDVRHQGGADWHYRLRIGDFPCATTPVPLAAKRGSSLAVTFAGPNVEGTAPVTVNVPNEPEAEVIWLTPTWTSGGAPGWPVGLALTDANECLETEPNDEPGKANRVAVPCAVSGRMAKKYDRDHFVFTGKKGERLIIEGVTQELQSPTSVYLVLKNAKGAQLAASNPTTDPARIDFTLPEDGDCTLAVEHLHYWGGPEESYRITLQLHEPGFTLAAALDRYDVPQGGLAIVTVNATRRDYAGPIEVSVSGPAGVTGTTTIPPGQNAALLALNAAADAAIGGQKLTISGKATIGKRAVVETAHVRSAVSQALGNLPFPPLHLHHALALAVTEKAPFTLEVAYGHPEGVRGGAVPVTLTIAKNPGFDEEVTLTSLPTPPVQGQPVAIPPVTGKIAKGQTQLKLDLKPAANAPLAPQALGFTARAKVGSKEHTVAALPAPLPLVLPFDLRVNAMGGRLTVPGIRASAPRPGPFHLVDALAGSPRPLVFGLLDLSHLQASSGKLKLKVTAVRKGGYKGPIALEVRNLPANVTATKPTVAENQSEGEIELTAAANAALGTKADVNVNGTATGLANQQNASGSFPVTIAK